MKNFILGLISIVIAIVFLAVFAEIVTRGYYVYKAHISNQKLFTIIELDDEFGWLPTSDYSFTGALHDAGGEKYPVDISTDKAGFRLYGNPQEKSKKKVLFLGDSYTQAMHVSDDKTYYGILKEVMDIEVFAYGVEGYGTLQEYMVLDKYVDEIKPDIVVLQFCPNDVVNNHPEMERRSSLNNMGLRRPYLVDNEVIYKTASSYPLIREFASRYSRFLYLIIKKIDLINVKPDASIERLIRKEGMANLLFSESFETAGQVLKKIKARVPSTTRVYAFSSDWGRPYHPEFKRISDKMVFTLLTAFRKELVVLPLVPGCFAWLYVCSRRL
jgi:hypothetical protein